MIGALCPHCHTGPVVPERYGEPGETMCLNCGWRPTREPEPVKLSAQARGKVGGQFKTRHRTKDELVALKAEARRMRERGDRLRDIGMGLGVDPGQVHKWLTR